MTTPSKLNHAQKQRSIAAASAAHSLATPATPASSATATVLPMHPRDWLLGIDRSDTRLDIRQCRRDGSQASDCQIANTPEALRAWVQSWPALEPGTARAIAFEQPCRQLLGFFHTQASEGSVRLCALNPHTPQAMRQAFAPSHDKTDVRDTAAITDVLRHHEDELARWRHQPADTLTRQLRRLSEDRRQAVDERTALSNALVAILKETFPQALTLAGDDLWRPLATDLLKRWPTLAELQSAKADTLRRFYYAHKRATAPI